MAIAAAMNGAHHHHHPSSGDGDDDDQVDGHEHDVVMPGFRFHPTEEELVEFYLRRKVEGKPFNVEVITFLDLYRYDPWELPALATMKGKEWFFYVPRDRKYRNGDRPNRVTTSGYWKATGADRMIKTESSRPIGLKKTLVFYTGKAPKGVRTSWIMNEYRLPQIETDRYQKAEISLCRVYKRTGVEDHHQLLPGAHSTRPSSSRGTSGSSKKQACTTNRHPSTAPAANPFQSTPSGDDLTSSDMDNMHEAAVSASNLAAADIAAAASTLQDHPSAAYMVAPTTSSLPPVAGLISAMPDDVDAATAPLHHSKDMMHSTLVSDCTLLSSSSSTSLPAATVDELNRLVGYHQAGYGAALQPSSHLFPLPSPTSSQLTPLMTSLPSSLAAFTDRLWEWNPIQEADRDYTNFK